MNADLKGRMKKLPKFIHEKKKKNMCNRFRDSGQKIVHRMA